MTAAEFDELTAEMMELAAAPPAAELSLDRVREDQREKRETVPWWGDSQS